MRGGCFLFPDFFQIKPCRSLRANSPDLVVHFRTLEPKGSSTSKDASCHFYLPESNGDPRKFHDFALLSWSGSKLWIIPLFAGPNIIWIVGSTSHHKKYSHMLNGGIYNLPFFRASSKHVAGSISSGVCFDSHLGLFQRYHI
jgi:hypothetical protein